MKFSMYGHTHMPLVSLTCFVKRREDIGDAELVLRAAWASSPCLHGLCTKTALLQEEEKIRLAEERLQSLG